MVCGLEADSSESTQEWWVQIRTPDGAQAWAKARDGFVSQEELNTNLAEKIYDSTVALPDKLAQIDAILRRGANLNGYGVSLSGTDPIWMAVQTKDVSLLDALISRGLDIKKSRPCAAESVMQIALTQGGDSLLDFLLRQGMPLNCLGQPPLHAVFGFGIATDEYLKDVSLESALRVAAILFRNGANIEQRNAQGQTIFETLDGVKSVPAAPRAAALNEALRTMSADASRPH